MKPIIVDMKDMSDSTEVYESRPNPFLIYTIYVIVLIVVVAFFWMYFFHMDVVVKSNGMFKGSNAVYEISSGVTGRVKENHVEDGQYVEEGKVLYVLDIDSLPDAIVRYQNELEASEARLEILSAYEKSLNGETEALEACADNPYYDEFINRRELLYSNITLSEGDTEGQTSLYQGNIDTISQTIAEYEGKIDKLNATIQCIKDMNNTFDPAADSYYYSLVSSYISSHSYTTLQYDNRIKEYQSQIDDYNKRIQEAEEYNASLQTIVVSNEPGVFYTAGGGEPVVEEDMSGGGESVAEEDMSGSGEAVSSDEPVGGEETVSGEEPVLSEETAGSEESADGGDGAASDGTPTGGDETANGGDTASGDKTEGSGEAAGNDEAEGSDEPVNGPEPEVEKVAIDVEALKSQRDALIASRDSVGREKIQALVDLELQHITAIEQQIAGYNDTILSMEANLVSAKLQLETVAEEDNETKEKVAILAEKGNVAAEILNYQERVEECESYLKSYDIQNDNCTVKASVSGYYYATQDLKTGTYVQEGAALGTIYPEWESKYYAEIYVENSDIAKVKVGQQVKFEIAAYPSSKYGYFTGVVENIAKDISIDQSTGYAYYLVKVKCDNMTIKSEEGEEASLINGMACQAKIVVDEKRVLTYLLEKIDLVD